MEYETDEMSFCAEDIGRPTIVAASLFQMSGDEFDAELDHPASLDSRTQGYRSRTSEVMRHPSFDMHDE